mmetsp:Transcript_9641/g.14122  ORF Transcript_9641/g.14122 Transcript_9641/m.14122 type:complete len:254 (-) Transcript_9641:90-851(-)
MKIIKYLLTLLFVGKLTDAFVAPNTGIVAEVGTALQSTNYERAMRSGYGSGYGGTGYGSSHDNNNGYYGNQVSRSSYNMDRYGSNSYDRGYGSSYGYGRGLNNHHNNYDENNYDKNNYYGSNNRYGNVYGNVHGGRYNNNEYGDYRRNTNMRGGNMRLQADGLPSFHELYQEQDFERRNRGYDGESYYNNGHGSSGRNNYGYNNRNGDYGGRYNNNGFNSNGNGYGRGYSNSYNNNYSTGNGYGGRYSNSYSR